MRRSKRIPPVNPLHVLALLSALAVLASCSKDSATNCNNTPTAPGCVPPPIAFAAITIFAGPLVAGDTTMGFAAATTSRGSALAQAMYNGNDLGVPGNSAPFQNVPTAGTAVYGARPIQLGATLRNALEETFTIAPINATSTIDKTRITLGDFVRVTVPAQRGRDSVVVFENGVRRAAILEGGGEVSITPIAIGTTMVTSTGFNGALTQAGSIFTVTVH